MKLNNISKLSVLGLIVTLSTLGCKHGPVGVTHLPNQGPGSTGNLADGLSSAPAINPDDKPIGDKNGLIAEGDHRSTANWTPDATVFKNFTVHFPYDSS